MIKYTIRIIRRNALGNHESIEIPLPRLGEILTPSDVFIMEYKLNEIPHMRFHIESREKNDDTQ